MTGVTHNATEADAALKPKKPAGKRGRQPGPKKEGAPPGVAKTPSTGTGKGRGRPKKVKRKGPAPKGNATEAAEDVEMAETAPAAPNVHATSRSAERHILT